MKKLGLIVTRVCGGLEKLYSLNTEGWEDRIGDERQRLEHLVLPDDNIPLVYLLSFNDSGCYLRIIKITSSRSHQYVSACIYIPCGVKPDAQVLNRYIEVLGEEVTRCAYSNENMVRSDVVDPLFTTEYQPEGPSYPNPRTNGMAYRFFGHIANEITLPVILEHLYQASYSNYESVFLIDRGSGIGIRHESPAEDLTEKMLAEPIILRKIVTTGRTQPTKIFVNDALYDGRPMYVGGLVDIKFEHTQYASIICKQCRVPDTGMIALQLNWKKKYSSEVIKVQDSVATPIEGCEISVGGQYLPVYLSEEEARSAEVKVVKKGYITAVVKKDLWNYPSVLITLEKEHFARDFFIDSTTDRDLAGKIKFELDMADNPKKSPIEGYRIGKTKGDDSVHLVYDEFGFLKDIKSIAIAVASLIVALIIGAFVGYGIANSSFEKKMNPQEQNAEVKDAAKKDDTAKDTAKTAAIPQDPDITEAQKAEAERVAAEQKAVSDAAAYLASHEKWTRGALDSQAPLTGLFNAVNTYDIEKLKEYAAKVPGFDWKPLLDAVEKGAARAKEKTGRGRYNAREDDTTITIAGYISYLTTKVFE